MVKKSKSKSFSNKFVLSVDETANEPEIPEIIENVEPRVLTIIITTLKQFTPNFPKSNIYVEVSHNECSIGGTEQVFVETTAEIPLDAEFEYAYNIASEKNLDELLSNPIYFVLRERLVTDTEDLVEIPDALYAGPSDFSIFSLEEPIFGQKDTDAIDDGGPHVKIKKDKQKGKKEKKVNSPKSLAKSRTSIKTSKTGKNNIYSNNNTFGDENVLVGSGNLDLSPLFLGETTISETIIMYPKQVLIDSKMVHEPFLPKLSVSIQLDKPIFSKEKNQKSFFNMFYITMESIFNLPMAFTEDMEYKIATIFPTENMGFSYVCFENGKFRDEYDFWLNNKFWPNMTSLDNFGGVTKQTISKINPNKLKTDLDINVKEIVENNTFRVTWNCVKQSWLTEDANDTLKKNIIKYRKWPIEIISKAGRKSIHIEKKKGKKGEGASQLDLDTSKKSAKDESKSMSRLVSKIDHKILRNSDMNHYMAIPDISKLLYPGVSNVRVACEIRSFNIQEYAEQTGVTTSFFDPSLQYFGPKFHKRAASSTQLEVSAKDTSTKDKKGSGKKSEKSKDDKKSKKSMEKRRSDGKREKLSLRQSIEQCEQSYPICNLRGEPTFLIIEVELKSPFQPRRTIEDITSELETIIPTREIHPNAPPPLQIATEVYEQTIKCIIAELNTEYQKYWKKEKGACKDISTPIFLRHLKSCGLYEKFITSTERAIALFVKEKFKYAHEGRLDYAHDRYVSTVYVNLVNHMNKLLHSTLICPFNNCDFESKNLEHNVLLSVREADELNMPWLAKRYLLETLARNPKTPNHWFELAVFYKGQKNIDKSLEAVKEALILDNKYKYGLLLCAVILYQQNEVYLAESTLLSLVNYYPDFLFGWVVLYMMYYTEGKSEGADVCMENIKEYQDTADINCNDEPILKTDPLGWTMDLCGKTGFMKTAVILIKIFELKLAEMAIFFDNVQHTAIHKYYLGVIYFESRNYVNALSCGLSAQKLYGPDYTVNSLIGHCYNKLERFTEAKDAYNFAIYGYNRPEDLHMMYLNLALIYDKENKLEKTKKFLLLVCKFSPTPFSWLRLGIAFYKLKNIAEAEACLTESNCLDNRMSETWAYLALINLEKHNIWEARQCHAQMLKYPLKDEELYLKVQEKIKAVEE